MDGGVTRSATVAAATAAEIKLTSQACLGGVVRLLGAGLTGPDRLVLVQKDVPPLVRSVRLQSRGEECHHRLACMQQGARLSAHHYP